jgi:hypothetical protein
LPFDGVHLQLDRLPPRVEEDALLEGGERLRQACVVSAMEMVEVVELKFRKCPQLSFDGLDEPA